MKALDIIAKKRDGLTLSREELDFMIRGFTQGDIPDYQVAAWLMAVYLQGMNDQETTHLTHAMAHSGRTLDVESIAPLGVDKHSTGGVGDKTTLVVAPLVVTAGLSMPKISGRGLGFTGGTLDKLESFPGFRSEMDVHQFLRNLKRYGIVVAGQTPDLVPADGLLYALRDVTATVGSIPLIASSIMSKKLAVGAKAIVLDVKVGEGAFMKNEAQAFELAGTMIRLAQDLGKRARAVISDMNQPLGRAVGNALEVKEAIETLQGGGPEDFVELCLTIATQMLLLVGMAQDEEEARRELKDLLDSGQAVEKLRELVSAQGGDATAIEDSALLPRAEVVHEVTTPREGNVSQLNAMEVGLTALELGAGRTKKGEPVDHAVGIVLHKKIGDRVQRGDTLCTIHARNLEDLDPAQERLLGAYAWQDDPVKPPDLIHRILSDPLK